MGRKRQRIHGTQPALSGRRPRHRQFTTLRRRRTLPKSPTITQSSTRRWRVSEVRTALAEQFDTLEQQHEASRLGLWTFLATEILFFGGLFLGYIVYHHAYPHDFTVAGKRTNV